MYTLAILVVLVGFVAGYSEISDPRTCLKNPPGSLLLSLALPQAGQCRYDSDCQHGAQCCFSGYFKKCQYPDPCEKVKCNEGYICQSRETPCKKPPCYWEATCLPATQVLCAAPACDTVECQPGFERVVGENGCPTCQCVKKKECGPSCKMFCALGFIQGADGCPLCSCNPTPENKCTNMTCGPNEECRFVEVVCKQAPCLPVATCVPILEALYENSCVLADRTTVGLPVLHSSILELDCSSQVCPDNTVCTSMGRTIKRCCWQSTQEQVLPPPKQGDCPLTRNNSEVTQECQFDQSCPGNQKCCSRQTDGISSRSHGLCESPILNTVKVVPAGCKSFSFIRMIMRLFGVC